MKKKKTISYIIHNIKISSSFKVNPLWFTDNLNNNNESISIISTRSNFKFTWVMSEYCFDIIHLQINCRVCHCPGNESVSVAFCNI